MTTIDEFEKTLSNKEYRTNINKELKKKKSDIKIVKGSEERWRGWLLFGFWILVMCGIVLTYSLINGKVDLAKYSDTTTVNITEGATSLSCPANSCVCPACNVVCPNITIINKINSS